MSATLQVKGLSAGHGAQRLFTDLDLVVAPGDVIGLVGPNGAGKTTVLRILAGLRPPEAGSVVVSPAEAQLGYLTQEPDRMSGESVRAQLARRTGVAGAQRDLDSQAMALAAGDPAADAAYPLALETWLALGGADLDDRMEVVTGALGLGVDLDLGMTALSGGQAARVGLAALLLSRYDAYLLDEPTNDLDAEGLDLLEEFVLGLDAPVVVVSHDREFLARTVTSVVEIDRSLERVATYGGGYEAYLDERSVARRRARSAYDDYAERRSALEARARVQRAWMEKGVKNARRKAKDNDKIGRKFRAESTEKQAAKARQTERLIERLDVVTEPRKEWQLQFEIAAAGRSGDLVAAVRGAVVRLGTFTLGPVDLQLHFRTGWPSPVRTARASRRCWASSSVASRPRRGLRRSAQVSWSVRWSRPAVPSSERLALADAFSRLVPAWPTADVRTLLAKFGLGANHVNRPAASLSPGERTRASLALLQARGVNLLVLDEPTNHLDLPAIEQLEEALDTFAGTVLLVTHDRRMLDNVRLTRRWHVDDGTVVEIARD